MAIGALVASCFTIGWQEESKAASIVLDNFNHRSTKIDISLTAPPSTVTKSQTGIMAGVLGGTRFHTLTLEETSTGNEVALGVLPPEFLGGPDRLSWSNGDGSKSTATTTWNADNAGLNVDIVSEEIEFLSALVVSVDLNVTVSVEITTGFGVDEQSASLFTTVTEPIIPGSGDKPIPFQFGFEDFLAENSNLNLQDIDEVVFTLTGPTNVDASIDLIEFQKPEVPEPTSILSILGIGVLGRFISRKKKNNNV